LLFRVLLRLLILFPVTGGATGWLVCVLCGVDDVFGLIFGTVEGALFGALICLPVLQVPFWKIALFTATGTVVFGTSSVWATERLEDLGGLLLLSPFGFWVGYIALRLYTHRIDPVRHKPIL